MTTYSLIPIRRPPFSAKAVVSAVHPDLEQSHRQRQQKRLEIVETCYDVVPTVLHQLQQQYPQTKFTCSKSKTEVQEEVQKGASRSLCAWRLTRETIVLRVVLNVDDNNDSLVGSLTCYFGPWQEQCGINTHELATTLRKLITVHGGWTPAIDHVPVHPYAG